ncbi:MAG: hypothetical protein OXL33_08450 [Chloroflexota bacterium]|nr:hypothetical protein [Chloroflexota bacterium]
MAEHPLSRPFLERFAVPARRSTLPHVWYLGDWDRRPHIEPIAEVATFELDCSPEVGRYVAGVQNRLDRAIEDVTSGRAATMKHWLPVLEFIAVHFVCSPTMLGPLGLELDSLVVEGALTPDQGDAEFERLTAHLDLATFMQLVQCATATCSNLEVELACPQDGGGFLTCDVPVCADDVSDLFEEVGVQVWFPLSPDVALLMHGEERWAPIMSLSVEGQKPGTVRPIGPPQQIQLRCSTDKPILVECEVYNALLAYWGQKLFSRSRAAIDAALARLIELGAEDDYPYRYRPG